MKKLLILSIIGILSLQTLKSQEAGSFNEIGLYFTNLKFDNFGFIFKTGSDKLVYRFSGLSVNAGNQKTESNVTNSDMVSSFSGFRLNFGIEKPLSINEKLNLYYGAELQGGLSGIKSYGNAGNTDNRSSNYSAGVGFVLGSTIRISKNLKLSAEIVPNLTYSQTTTKPDPVSEHINSRLDFKLNNNSAALILGYRF
jgi:hypothetical protein